jgi:hypothetical protein
MSATKPYTIIIPPGTYTIGTIALKPWVNIRGAGGRNRMTIFKSGALNLLDASIPAGGVHRFRMDGIRMETVPVTFVCTTNGKTLLVCMDDCPCNGSSPLVTTGEAYGAATTMINLELRNLNLDKNSAPQMFTYTRLSAWGCTLLGMYFTSSDAYFYGCDIGSQANVVNAGADGGWFEFNGCKIDTMALNDPTSESVLATLCGGGNENVQVHGTMHGYSLPTSLTNWSHFQPGTYYFCHSDNKLYLKTGIIGVNTWQQVPPVENTTKTVKKTISWHGGDGDFKLPDAGNTNESQLDLGALVPALARIVDVFTVTTEAAVFSGGATTLVADMGTSAGDGSLIVSATVYAIDAIIASPNAGAFIASPLIGATNIFFNSTPGANWDTQTAGKISVYVTYIDVTGL